MSHSRRRPVYKPLVTYCESNEPNLKDIKYLKPYDGSDSFTDSDEEKNCDKRKTQFYIRSTVDNCIKRMRCGFTCVNPKFCACLTFYLLCSLLMLGFLYLYGSTIIAQISRLLRIMIHALLPASWLKSTKDIINEALYKYNADRLGLADYALESAGGSILCSSETYYSKSGPLYSIFGIPLWYHASSPREVIQPDVAPGKCWAMDGSQGFVTIQLAMPVVVTAVSLEHIPKELSPSGKLYSAPRDFYIVGRERGMDSPELILGSYTYRVGQDPIQVFEIKDPFCLMKSVTSDICGVNQHVFNIITLKIMNNYGNPDYTCIYRLRVHGKPTSLIE